MKKLLLSALCILTTYISFGQTIVDPSGFPVLTPTMDNFAIYTRENQINKKVLPAALRTLMLPIVRQPADITYTPASTGNSNDKGSFVRTPLGRIYFIDGLGNSLQTNAPYASATIADNDIHAGVMCVPIGGWYRVSNNNTMGIPPGTLRQRVFGSTTTCTNAANPISPGQTRVVGGAGILKTNGDPDTNPYVQRQDQWVEASMAYDTVLRQVYTYNSAGTVGNRWNVFSGASVDTRVDTAYIQGDTLKLFVLDVGVDTMIDTIKVPLVFPVVTEVGLVSPLPSVNRSGSVIVKTIDLNNNVALYFSDGSDWLGPYEIPGIKNVDSLMLAPGQVKAIHLGRSGATTGQVYKWNGSAWAPADEAASVGTIQEEGSDLTQRPKLNFVGSSATAADNSGSNRTDVTFDSDLNALASNSTNGILTRTGSGTVAARTITGNVDRVSVTNGDGVSGNIDIDVPSINIPADRLPIGTGSNLTSSANLAFNGTTLTVSNAVASAQTLAAIIKTSAGANNINLLNNDSGTSSGVNLNIGTVQGGGDGQIVYHTNQVFGTGNFFRTGQDNSDSDIFKMQAGNSSATLTGTAGYQQNTANEISINAAPVSGVKFLVAGTTRFNLGSDATGDLYRRNSSGNFERIPIGSTGQVLKVASGIPAWGTDDGGTGAETIVTAGTGISVSGTGASGTPYVITNTAPNVVQELSIDGSDLSLSNGGGTVTLPGGDITWPLLAPDGSNTNPSYSFANSTGTGLYYSADVFGVGSTAENVSTQIVSGPDGSITISVGPGVGLFQVQSGYNPAGKGGGVTINAGDGSTDGGDFLLASGYGEGGNAGSFTLSAVNDITGTGVGGEFIASAGNGATGGDINIVSGNSSDDAGGNISLRPGSGSDGNGVVYVETGDGLVFPNLTTSQVSAISTPLPGQTVYCTDCTANDTSTGVIETWNGSAWKKHW